MSLRRPREFLRPRLQVLEEGRPRLDRSAACHRAVVRRVLLHGRQHGRRRQDQQVGDGARARREERHRSSRTKCRGWCRPPSGSGEKMHEKWYAGETISVGNRPGRGVGDAGVDGGLHGDARQRRHAGDAAPAESGRRRQRVEAGAAAGAAVDSRRSSPRSCRRSATACGWW